MSLTIASSATEVAINIITELNVWPTNIITIPPNTNLATFKLTGYVPGIYKVSYEIYSRDQYSSVDDSHIIIYSSSSSLSSSILQPGCCTISSPINYCPNSVEDIIFSSTSSIWSSSNQILTHGITFVTSNDIQLPLSITGTDAKFTYDSISVSPLSTDITLDGQCIANCTSNGNVTTDDIYTMAQSHSLLRTFLSSINAMIPSNITISQASNNPQSSYKPFNFMASLSKFSDLDEVEGCSTIETSQDNFAYALRASNIDINITVNGQTLQHRASDDIFCIALDVCTVPQDPVYISIPKNVGSLISSLSSFAPFTLAGWAFDISSVRLSSYGVNYNDNVWLWNGTELIHVSLVPHDVGITVESHHSQINGFLTIQTSFTGDIDISLENNVSIFLI